MNNIAIKLLILFCVVFFNVFFNFFNLPVEYSYKLKFMDNSSAPRPITLVDMEGAVSAKVTNGLLFTYKDRKALSVSISGNFSSWARLPMKRGVNGVWYYFYSVGSEERPGGVKYKFYTDGIWTHDPRNPFKEDDGAGSILSLSSLPSPYYTTRVTYRVMDKNTVEFRTYNSGARIISLVGDFNNWNPENDLMKRGDDGIWRLVKKLPAGRYRYIYLVDGMGTPDIYNPESSSTVNGDVCSILTVK
jgi:1,4-alpha-glucan branching enzyme